MNVKMPRRSIPLLLSVIIGVFLLIFTWIYISDTLDSSSAGIGASIAAVLVLPHQILSTLACFFAALGWALNVRWAAMVAAILYTIALAVMPPWFSFVVVQMVLCYVAFVRMGRAPIYTAEFYDSSKYHA